jgi:hypothetical protein
MLKVASTATDKDRALVGQDPTEMNVSAATVDERPV